MQAYTNQATGVALHARHVSGNHAVFAEATDFGSGVVAESTFGSAVSGVSTKRIGIQGSGGSYGGAFGGGVAALRLSPSSFTGPPARLLAHSSGELSVDNQGDLWFCSDGIVPERWHKLNQPSFQPSAPTRVYDSRRPAPTPGTLSTGLNRLVSVADARNISTGAVTVTDVVPVGATAIAANVTVTNTSGSGFLAINPGGDTVVAASTINWFGPGQTLANGVVLTLNASREITAICGGSSGATHFIIDVTGYFL